MLHTETVKPATLGLLKKLLAASKLKDFALVDGTNLALRFGHTLSDDIDLLTNNPFDLSRVKNTI